MVVNDNDIVFEARFLRQGRTNSIRDGFLSIENGNHHRCLIFEILLVEVNVYVCRGVYSRSNGFQVSRCHLFHFYLHVPITRIHVVELLLSALSGIEFHFGIQAFVDAKQGTVPTQKQTQVVHACKLVLCNRWLGGVSMQQTRFHEQHLSEIEIIAYAT